MTLGKTTAFRTRAFAIALVVMAGSLTCGPAPAQYWGDSSSGGWGGWGWGGRSSGGWGNRYPSHAIIDDRPTAIFFLRSLASAAIVQRQPSTTRRRRRRVN